VLSEYLLTRVDFIKNVAVVIGQIPENVETQTARLAIDGEPCGFSNRDDEILGRVVERLRQLGWEASTDIIVTQDHGHGTVSGDVAYFPLRSIIDRGVGAYDPHGYSVSGFVRTAELLTRDGLTAFDGAGCRDIPILSGITADGTHLQPRKDDQHGNVCGRAEKYTSPSYVVPKPIPAGAIVVAANAGSDYLFVPDGNIETVKAAVVSLQSRLQFGAIFVSDRYGEITGTLPMSLIKTENSVSGRAPDIIVSFSYDQNVAVAGKSGVSYASSVNRRGDHGSFSPTDTQISLLASGPDFKSGFHDPLPTANVDIAPPRFTSIGFMPAATALAPSLTIAWASTVAVVVPSPAKYDVFDAISFTSCAPMFSNLSSSSISFATVTPPW
jgi:hypothetical protein